jgi:hypothetical protein
MEEGSFVVGEASFRRQITHKILLMFFCRGAVNFEKRTCPGCALTILLACLLIMEGDDGWRSVEAIIQPEVVVCRDDRAKVTINERFGDALMHGVVPWPAIDYAERAPYGASIWVGLHESLERHALEIVFERRSTLVLREFIPGGKQQVPERCRP